MSKIHAEMKPWRQHLKECAEEEKREKTNLYIGNSKD